MAVLGGMLAGDAVAERLKNSESLLIVPFNAFFPVITIPHLKGVPLRERRPTVAGSGVYLYA